MGIKVLHSYSLIGISPLVLLLGFALETALQAFCGLVLGVVWVLFVALQHTFLTVIVIGAVGVPVGLLGIWSFAHYPRLAPASMQGPYSLQQGIAGLYSVVICLIFLRCSDVVVTVYWGRQWCFCVVASRAVCPSAACIAL